MTLLGNLCAEAGVKPVLDAPVNENLKIVERSASDGLFVRSGLFYVLPKVSLKPLEELFRARVITFLLEKGLLPPDRARMLRGWVHSGFNAHRSRRVLPNERDDLERLAQYTRLQRCAQHCGQVRGTWIPELGRFSSSHC